MPEGNEPHNGRVTNAILKTKLDNMHEDIKSTLLLAQDNARRITVLETTQGRHDERLGHHRQDIDGLQKRGWVGDSVAYIGVIVGTIIGYFNGK